MGQGDRWESLWGRGPGPGSEHRPQPLQHRGVGAARDSEAPRSRSRLRREKQAPRWGRAVPRSPGTTAAGHWRGSWSPLEHAAPAREPDVSGPLCPPPAPPPPPQPHGVLGWGRESERPGPPPAFSAGAVGPPQTRSWREGGDPLHPRPLHSPQAPVVPLPAEGSPESCAPLRGSQQPGPRRRRSATARPGGGIAEIEGM